MTKFGLHQPTKFQHFKFQRWQTAAIFKIEKLQYLRNHLTDFDEI